MKRGIFFVDSCFVAEMFLAVTSVFCFVLFFFPLLESFDGEVVGEVLAGDGALVFGEGEFVVDKLVGEVDVGGVFFAVAVDNAVDASPIDGAEAHGAGFARAIDGGAAEGEGVLLGAGLAYGHHFGVGGGVVVEGDAVFACGYNLSIAHYHSAKGAAAFAHALFGLLGCKLQKMKVFVGEMLLHNVVCFG